MLSKTFSMFGHPVLVTQVNPRQYGHLALEITMSMLLARRSGSSVYFLRPRRVVSEALFAVRTDEVRVLPRSFALDAAFRAAWSSADVLERTSVEWHRGSLAIRDEFRRELSEYMRGRKLDRDVQRALTKVKDDVRGVPRGSRKALPLYYQRRLLRERIAVRIDDRRMPDVREAAGRHGLDVDAPMVTLHVRESGFKFGREMQDAKPGARDDSTRNARVDTYFDAIDWLVARGITVIRIGDPSMTPVARAGVVDLATSPHRSQLLEVYCMAKSEFFISAEAGPVGVSYLTDTPLLTVNATDPISSYPIRDDGFLLLKHVHERQSGRELRPSELLTDDYLLHLRNVMKYRYADNTPEEIAAAVAETHAWVHGQRVETPLQAQYRALATDAGSLLRATNNYVRKWGSDEGFLGDGRIVTSYAAQAI